LFYSIKEDKKMNDQIDKEVDAIKTLLLVLKPLEPSVRESVLEYVLKRLNINLREAHVPIEALPEPPQKPTEPQIPTPPVRKDEVHIKDLREEKKPKSAIEMTALVAYYLSHLAPKNERKDTITRKDIETYFKIAEYRLPSQIAFTLPNTKRAGYLDSAGQGKYKLNPVGYNLVVHSLPQIEQVVASRPKTKKAAKKKPSKKTAAKRK
jgi:hypothetical protein